MTRRWMAILAVAVTGAAAGPAPASGQAVFDGGCTVLAETVRSAVTEFIDASRIGVRPVVARGSGALVDGAPQSCGRTAAAASAAFGFAFARVDVPVDWPAAGLAVAGYCAFHDLARCHPGSRDAAVVAAWQAIADCLERYMPFGTDGDVSHFRAHELASALARALTGAGKAY